MSSKRPYIIIGNPGQRRVDLFCQALERHSYPNPTIIAYSDILQDWDNWSSAIHKDCIVRIESPGEDRTVMDNLLYLAAIDPVDEHILTAQQLDELPRSRGEIICPRQRFLGFQRLMNHIQDALEAQTPAYVMNHPEDILAMFDKEATYARFMANQVPCPKRLERVEGYDDLLAKMDEENLKRVFVKLRYSSSASGVVAYHRQGHREMATTSSKLRQMGSDVRLFNSLKIQKYNDSEDIRTLIDMLAHQGVVTEGWLSKASFERKAYDFRIVVIRGQAQHCVVRTSHSPMTNLHLGNARGDLDALKNHLPEHAWENAMRVAEQAFSSFNQMTYAGADVMLHNRTMVPYAIEINAFGDLVPRITFEGEDTYGAQILAVEKHLAGCV